MEFNKIELKPLSLSILAFLNGRIPMKAEDIAEALNLKTRQVDAAVTKSLIRYNFAVREYKLTRVLKRDFSVIKITERGKEYIEFLNK